MGAGAPGAATSARDGGGTAAAPGWVKTGMAWIGVVAGTSDEAM